MSSTSRATRALLLVSLCLSPSLYAQVPNTWSPTGSLPAPLSKYTLTLLASGEALAAAGCNDFFCNTPSRGSSTYDPATGVWTPAGDLIGNRMSHAATLLANGKVLVSGGCVVSTGCPGINTAELYDPNTRGWTATMSMLGPRRSHASTRLQDGRVLVTGGIGRCDAQVCVTLPGAELYDPQSGQWASAASMPQGRIGHSATLLQDGRVLVVGGCTGTGLPCGTLGAIVYDPASNSWSNTGGLQTPRTEHTAVALPSGEVVVAGGLNNGGFFVLTIESYNAAQNAWSPAGSLVQARFDGAATLLPTGQILYAGGATAASELYDPATDVSTPTDSMSEGRSNFGMVTLDTGDALAAGGDNGNPVASADLYHPGASPLVSLNKGSVDFGLVEIGTASAPDNVRVTNAGQATLVIQSVTFTGPHPEDFLAVPAGNCSAVPRGGNCFIFMRFIPTQLRDRSATMLITDNAPDSPQSVAVHGFAYAVAPNQWAPGANMNEARSEHTATRLGDGTILVAGGAGSASAETYDAAVDTWTPTGPMTQPRVAHIAALLIDGRVLAAGGGNASAELYDDATRTWSATGGMSTVRRHASAARLPDGRVLVSGGCNDSACTSAETYDPSQGQWAAAAPMNVARVGATATTLANGRVLVAGGGSETAELYDASTNTWALTDSMRESRRSHTATLLVSGRVLVAGGCDGGPCKLTEQYDPARARWLPSPSLVRAKVRQSAAVLADGRVLAEGGTYFCDPEFGFCFTTNDAEIYSPATNRWERSGKMIIPRERHTSTLLPDGRVLVTGGDNDTNVTPFNSTEIFTP